ncbi:bacteriohopanetetrol glucosamine biosynthesis glycosyltransferase HpnI [Aetokthonos hydrillicola Thurmond2011]|jgi:ceramide glucosyltransferase|uniref:Bacteriohopanetetrol glucosamine biosynthesis glycosyltransferase HpnI n=1 Tax=Aetokthonos hydrillicola Thurmond2011 TaxID=2712845 RepID=A0AAP5M837_9CYAN|nr:bacteriohopanetetrol glucosamine biosynthesis glycosyltransferase HpnI [Aetokthonos hydrillicola]MBO3459272.1 glycosyltransferase [Aetokthonos hydrillicola CCALA 1050]MBW4590582.1 bacteriohopanetetrol glucosamine biosynthesis glycosyltransferase HpnI [Aetokthonos hydrillicola CCALA 1050]MDR9894347.1 bacteriohopanetetrol glucosamine biosynthesis glycosyltransferase HpnI [Aetokthonos hydrillicola Thurmond2011]
MLYETLGFYLTDIFHVALTTLNLNIIGILLLILCLSAVLFYCYGIYAAIAFRRCDPINPDFHPPVTILKPICGLDSDTYKNLASFCRQDYPDYQIIFCVRESQDPGIAVVKQIIQEFPKLDIHLVVSDRTIGTNFKVSNLENGIQAAKHEILLIADSDIRVGSDYLQRVVQPLHDSSVGVVTCLYRTIAQGWVTTLEAIGTATDFHASVLVSNQLQGIKFAFGSTIVIRKEVLQKIGGFGAIADYLADDYQLGYLPAQAGYKVLLSNYIVEHVLAPSTIINAINHQSRWIRCVRVSRPWGYVGLIFTYGTVTSLLLLITTGGSILSWIVLIITWIARLIVGWVVGVKILNDPVAKKYLWLIPIRDLISFAIWCYGFFGTTVEWRGRRLRLTKEGKLVPI